MKEETSLFREAGRDISADSKGDVPEFVIVLDGELFQMSSKRDGRAAVVEGEVAFVVFSFRRDESAIGERHFENEFL